MSDKVRVKLAPDYYLDVDVEGFKQNKTVLNIDCDGEIIKCKCFAAGDCFVMVPEKLILG